MDDPLQQASADFAEAAEIFAKVGRQIASMAPAETAEERRRQAQGVRRAAGAVREGVTQLAGLANFLDAWADRLERR